MTPSNLTSDILFWRQHIAINANTLLPLIYHSFPSLTSREQRPRPIGARSACWGQSWDHLHPRSPWRYREYRTMIHDESSRRTPRCLGVIISPTSSLLFQPSQRGLQNRKNTRRAILWSSWYKCTSIAWGSLDTTVLSHRSPLAYQTEARK